MATTPVSNETTFVFLVPNANLTVGPSANPWRPALHTVNLEAIAGSAVWGSITGVLGDQADLSAAFAAETLSAVLARGNTTGASDVVVTGGQAVRGAAASTLTLVGPTGFSATATTGTLALSATAADVTIGAGSIA